MKMLTVCFIFFRGMQNENVDCLFYFFQRYAEWKCWLFVLFFSEVCRMKMLTLFYFFQRYAEWKCWLFVLFFSEVYRIKMLTVLFFSEVCRMQMLTYFFRGLQNENVDCSFYFFQRYAEWKCWLFALLCLPPLLWGDILFLSSPSVRHKICQRNSSETTEQNFMKLGR